MAWLLPVPTLIKYTYYDHPMQTPTMSLPMTVILVVVPALLLVATALQESGEI